MSRYDKGRFSDFLKQAVEITDYWDFSGFNEISHDPRNFYDPTHYKYRIGEMMLARIFNNKSVYIPDDFGFYVTKDNVNEYVTERKWSYEPLTIPLPILTYHHLDENVESWSSVTVSPDKFKSDMIALLNAGFTTISFKELIDFSNGEYNLPQKPIIITFDDGYLSNFEYAYPILAELNMKACVSIVGWSVGKDSNAKQESIIPHFTWGIAKEMFNSGVFEIGSHTYDCHEDGSEYPFRRGINMIDGESLEEYTNALHDDFSKMKNLIESNVGNEVIVFAYPFGEHTQVSEDILKELGFKVTLTTERGINYINKNSQFFKLKRINVPFDITANELIESFPK